MGIDFADGGVDGDTLIMRTSFHRLPLGKTHSIDQECLIWHHPTRRFISPITTDRKPTEPMKKLEIDPSERFVYKFRPTLFQYELLARLAVMAPHKSMQRIIEDRIFTRKTSSQMRSLRESQRERGHRDVEFYPPALLRRMGIKVARGRPKRRAIRTGR